MSELKSSLCIIAAGVLWGLLPLFIKYLGGRGFSPEQIVFTRVLFAAGLLSLWLAVRKPALLRIRPRDAWCFAGTGIGSIMLFSYCYFRTIEQGNIALAALLLYTSPVFVLGFSILFFKERLTGRKLLAVASTVAGCVCITGVLSHGTPDAGWPVILTGLGAGLFYSLYTIFGKYALRRYDSLTVTAYTFIFATLGTAFLVPLPQTFSRFAGTGVMLAALGMALLCTLVSFALYTVGLKGVAPSKAGVLATVEPVVATLTGILVFHENAGLDTLAGVILIVAATVLLNTPGTRARRAPVAPTAEKGPPPGRG